MVVPPFRLCHRSSSQGLYFKVPESSKNSLPLPSPSCSVACPLLYSPLPFYFLPVPNLPLFLANLRAGRAPEMFLPHSSWAVQGAGLSWGQGQWQPWFPSLLGFLGCSLPVWEQVQCRQTHPPPVLSLAKLGFPCRSSLQPQLA